MSKIDIIASRHSAFYSPLISTISGDFLKEEGFDSPRIEGNLPYNHVLIRWGDDVPPFTSILHQPGDVPTFVRESDYFGHATPILVTSLSVNK